MGSVEAAMVLCAGLGTRLRPLSDELAKPMVPVGDRPAVAHVLARVRLLAPSRVVVNVHHRACDVRPWAESERVEVSEEPTLLGTAGGLSCAAALLGAGDVLVWNGDILSDLDPREVVRAHQTGRPRAATLAVRPRPSGQGNVGLGEDGRIVRLRDRAFGVESAGGDFLGVHVVAESLRNRLPDRGCLVGDVYIPALGRGEPVYAMASAASFVDIGSLARYRAANARWLEERGLRSWAHPSATVRAPIDGSVVGAGASVEAPASFSVVWPGARVHAACDRAVVTSLHVLLDRPASADDPGGAVGR